MVTIIELLLTCDAAPVQYEGKLSNGWYIYARSRHSRVSVSLSPDSIHGAISDPVVYVGTEGLSPARFHEVTAEQLNVLCQWLVATTDWDNL